MKYNSMLKEMMTGKNHEGAKAYAMTPELELYSAVVTASLSDTFYEKQDERFVCHARRHVYTDLQLVGHAVL